MKDLLVDSGDLVISRNDLQLISKGNLTAQKVRLNLGTNKGEWQLNQDLGINFKAFLGQKHPNKDEILDTVLDGLRQIDESFRITEYSFGTNGRHMTLTFTAVNDSNEELSLDVGVAQSTTADSWLIRALADLVEV
jgi:hypothetical protein